MRPLPSAFDSRHGHDYHLLITVLRTKQFPGPAPPVRFEARNSWQRGFVTVGISHELSELRIGKFRQREVLCKLRHRPRRRFVLIRRLPEPAAVSAARHSTANLSAALCYLRREQRREKHRP